MHRQDAFEAVVHDDGGGADGLRGYTRKERKERQIDDSNEEERKEEDDLTPHLLTAANSAQIAAKECSTYRT